MLWILIYKVIHAYVMYVCLYALYWQVQTLSIFNNKIAMYIILHKMWFRIKIKMINFAVATIKHPVNKRIKCTKFVYMCVCMFIFTFDAIMN